MISDRDDHPLAHPQPLTLADLSGQPMILTGRDSSVRDQVERVFDDHGLRLVVRAEANYLSTVLALVQQITRAEQGLSPAAVAFVEYFWRQVERPKVK